MSESSYTEYVCDGCGVRVVAPYEGNGLVFQAPGQSDPLWHWEEWSREIALNFPCALEKMLLCPSCAARIRGLIMAEKERIKGERSH